MKRLFLIPMMLLLLGGCSSSNGPVTTVENMYNAAVDRDIESFTKILSGFDGLSGYEQEAMADLASDVIDLGGVSEMNITELEKDDLKDEFVDELNERFNDWAIVSVELGEDYHYFWLLQKIDGEYYVIDGDDFKSEDVLK